MGIRGPIGKRSDERMGHQSQAQIKRSTKAPGAKSVPWHAADPNWHHEAKQLYDGLKRSGQARFFEPSDVALAYFLAGQTSRFLENPRVNGQVFSAIMTGWADLLATEASRRRLHIELQRDDEEEAEDPIKKIMAEYAKGFNAPSTIGPMPIKTPEAA